MKSWQAQLKADSLPWLLETSSPAARYLTLRDLLDAPDDDRELLRARAAASREGPIAAVLAHMNKAGYWAKAGPGYNPKYYSTVWSIILLAQLGASIEQDKRISKACAYILDHALMEGGQLSATGTPAGTADCLQGNLCWSLLALGYDDSRLKKAFDWMARSVTGEGIAPVGDRKAPLRYFGGKCGPNFACSANARQPCAWGAVKVALALGRWPESRRGPIIKRAIRQTVAFLFSVDPATAAYPTWGGQKPSGDWWKFGFPIFYVTDLLQLVEALIGLGYGHDRRLSHALGLIRQKQDEDGRWALEYGYAGKTWVDFGPKRQANKWVTLRALRVLKAADESPARH